MSTTTAEKTAIERYLDAVRAELADLPDAERVDVLEDVEQHLLEVAAEGDEPIESRLGPPVEYAAELRAAAGLPPRGSGEDPFARSWAARIGASRMARAIDGDLAKLRRTTAYREVRMFLPQLRPAWWVLRGYLVAVIVGAASSTYPHAPRLFPHVSDNPFFGLLLTIAAIVASVAWSRAARRDSRGWRTLTIAGNVATVVVALTLLDNGGGYQRVQYVDSQEHMEFPSIVRGPYGNILNIYPYAADGTPLDGVLLYDQEGRPIPGVVMDEYSTLHGHRAATGEIVPNMFPYPEPIRDPPTGEVRGQKQRPVILPPTLQAATPPAGVATGTQAPSAAVESELPTPSAAVATGTELPSASSAPDANLGSPSEHSQSSESSESSESSPSPSPSRSAAASPVRPSASPAPSRPASLSPKPVPGR